MRQKKSYCLYFFLFIHFSSPLICSSFICFFFSLIFFSIFFHFISNPFQKVFIFISIVYFLTLFLSSHYPKFLTCSCFQPYILSFATFYFPSHFSLSFNSWTTVVSKFLSFSFLSFLFFFFSFSTHCLFPS